MTPPTTLADAVQEVCTEWITRKDWKGHETQEEMIAGMANAVAAALLAPGGWFEGLAQEDCVCGHRADDHSWSGCLIVNAKTEVSCGCKHRPTEALVATLRTTA